MGRILGRPDDQRVKTGTMRGDRTARRLTQDSESNGMAALANLTMA